MLDPAFAAVAVPILPPHHRVDRSGRV